MGRVYTVTAENTTLANASGDIDIFEITPADDKPIRILGFEIDNVSTEANDRGDTGEEFLRLAIIRGHTGSGSGTGATPVPIDPGDTAASFTAETNGATIASGGTTTTVWAGGMNVRIPGPIFFGDASNPLMCPKATQANTTIVLRMLSTVADDIAVSATLWVLEE